MNIQSGFRKRLLLLVLFAAVIAVCFYTISQVHRVPLMENGGRSFVKAQVVSIVQDHEQAGDIYIGDQTVQLKLLTGEHAGETVQATSSSAYLYGVHCTVGMKVIAIVSESGGELVTSVYGYNRAPALYAIVGLFLLSILIIGGKRGLYAVIGLLFTFVSIIWFFFARAVPRLVSHLGCYRRGNFDNASHDVSGRRLHGKGNCRGHRHRSRRARRRLFSRGFSAKSPMSPDTMSPISKISLCTGRNRHPSR